MSKKIKLYDRFLRKELSFKKLAKAASEIKNY